MSTVYDGGWLPITLLPTGMSMAVDLWVVGPAERVSQVALQFGQSPNARDGSGAPMYEGRVVSCRLIGSDWHQAAYCGVFRRLEGVKPTHWRMPPSRPA